MLKQIPISVIIPTYNRTTVLFNTIRSLCSGSAIPDEIIVVDQTVPPVEFPQDLQAMMQTGPLQVLHADTPSLTKSRNIGLRKAKNEIVLFCDDDILIGGGGGDCKRCMTKCAMTVSLWLRRFITKPIFCLTASRIPCGNLFSAV